MTSRPEVKEMKAQRRIHDLAQALKSKGAESVRLESPRALGELPDVEAMKEKTEKVPVQAANGPTMTGADATCRLRTPACSRTQKGRMDNTEKNVEPTLLRPRSTVSLSRGSM